MVVSFKKIYFALFSLFLSLSYSNNGYIDVITTNDMHGFLNEQKALIINPNYPPQVVGAAGFYHYVKEIESNLMKKSNDKLMLDDGIFFQVHPGP